MKGSHETLPLFDDQVLPGADGYGLNHRFVDSPNNRVAGTNHTRGQSSQYVRSGGVRLYTE